MLNSRVHSAIGHLPFFLMQGYQPQFHVPANPNTYVPEADSMHATLQHQAQKRPTSRHNGACEDTIIGREVLS